MGQARAAIKSFGQHASEMQSTVLPSDDDKMEIKETNELLQGRFQNVSDSADERKSE